MFCEKFSLITMICFPFAIACHFSAYLLNHNSGAGATGARPTVVESIMVDGKIGGSVYDTIYPTRSGSQNGAETDLILPEGLSIRAEGLLHYPVYI